ncbi:Succinyl-CoA:3-ketoacid coenzyme A transferase 1, mitochondrial [Orchesella cincta]|uniref:Succinyl-CoA:3-ketoacid coenzyme A transferase 1, mitochondrial n=1 Tax=Orchesella cincta TaxID=48709 RepID=A0A1D2M620_ORCCI|nr:Succinyl-CoA:3-ketoacid coenzyme A transferase 1, mitochondrial [Orchesella cincta]
MRQPWESGSRSNYIPEGITVTLQSENGVLGLGPFPVDAKTTLGPTKPSRCFLDRLPNSIYSYNRSSRHVQLTILGAMQVQRRSRQLYDSRQVDERNGRSDGPGLVVNRRDERRVAENPQILRPVANWEILRRHDHHREVFRVDKENGLELVELSEGVDIHEIVDGTGCEFVISDELQEAVAA